MDAMKSDNIPKLMAIAVKAAVFALPVILLPYVIRCYTRGAVGLSVLLGAVLQSLFPPGRRELLVIALPAAFALAWWRL